MQKLGLLGFAPRCAQVGTLLPGAPEVRGYCSESILMEKPQEGHCVPPSFFPSLRRLTPQSRGAEQRAAVSAQHCPQTSLCFFPALGLAVFPSCSLSSGEWRWSELAAGCERVAQGPAQWDDDVDAGLSVAWACPALDPSFQAECVHGVTVTHPLATVGPSGVRHEGLCACAYACACVCDLQNLLAAEYKYLYRYLP